MLITRTVSRRRFIFTAREFIVCFALINLIVSKRLYAQAIWFMLLTGAALGALTVFQEVTQTHNLNYLGFAQVKIAQIADGIVDRPRAGGPTGEPLAFGQQLDGAGAIGSVGGDAGALVVCPWYGGAFATIACIAGVALSFSRSTYIALAVVLHSFHAAYQAQPALPPVPTITVCAATSRAARVSRTRWNA